MRTKELHVREFSNWCCAKKCASVAFWHRSTGGWCRNCSYFFTEEFKDAFVSSQNCHNPFVRIKELQRCYTCETSRKIDDHCISTRDVVADHGETVIEFPPVKLKMWMPMLLNLTLVCSAAAICCTRPRVSSSSAFNESPVRLQHSEYRQALSQVQRAGGAQTPW